MRFFIQCLILVLIYLTICFYTYHTRFDLVKYEVTNGDIKETVIESNISDKKCNELKQYMKNENNIYFNCRGNL